MVAVAVAAVAVARAVASVWGEAHPALAMAPALGSEAVAVALPPSAATAT